MTSAAARHDLYNALRETLGDSNADTLMNFLPAISGEELANRAEVAAMRSDLVGLRAEMQIEFQAVRTEMRSEFKAVRQEMRSEFKAVRQEITTLVLTQVGDLHKRVDRLFIAQVASTLALFTAILAT